MNFCIEIYCKDLGPSFKRPSENFATNFLVLIFIFRTDEVSQNNDLTNTDGGANDVGPVRRRHNQLHSLSTYGQHAGGLQIFYITLANQLVPGREGGFLLVDPNHFLYRYNGTVNNTRYYLCHQTGCPGRCNVKNESVTIPT